MSDQESNGGAGRVHLPPLKAVEASKPPASVRALGTTAAAAVTLLSKRNASLGVAAVPRLRQAFNALDRRRTGAIDKEQFKAFLVSVGVGSSLGIDDADVLPLLGEDGVNDLFTAAIASQAAAVATRGPKLLDASEAHSVTSGGSSKKGRVVPEAAAGGQLLSFLTLVDWYGSIVAEVGDRIKATASRSPTNVTTVAPQQRHNALPALSVNAVSSAGAPPTITISDSSMNGNHFRESKGSAEQRPSSGGLTRLVHSSPADGIREFIAACLRDSSSAGHVTNGDPAVSHQSWGALDERGFNRVVVDLIAAATANPNLDPHRALSTLLSDFQEMEASSRSPNSRSLEHGVAASGTEHMSNPFVVQKAFKAGKVKGAPTAPTLAFTSALSLYHLHNSPDAHLPLDACAAFVDISGYSSVSAALEDGGPHQLAQVVNSYLELVVATITACGGDVVKFAGDALVALWYTEVIDVNIRAAAHCAWKLQNEHPTFPIPNNPDLFFQLHIGIAEGTVYSRVFAPRKFASGMRTPSHFHFVSGEPMMAATVACDAAPRGKIYVTEGVAQALQRESNMGSASPENAGSPLLTLGGIGGSDVAATATHSAYQLRFLLRDDGYHALPAATNLACVPGADSGAALGNSMEAHVHLFELTGVSFVDDAPPSPSGAAHPKKQYKPPRPPQKLSHGGSEKVFIPPHIVDNMAAGLDQFYLAEMRELTVFFIHFSGSTDEEVWFDELHSVLEGHGAATVQIIDDDKGVHVVAAINLYNISHGAPDTAAEIALALMTRVPDTRIGVASGTVLCGVLGSNSACQWDITGPACVRACRLMQNAVANDIFVLFDASVFERMKDKSKLKEPYSIRVKGNTDTVSVCTIHREGFGSGSWRRSSKIALVASLPDLFFSVQLCPDVHRELVDKIKQIFFTVTPAMLAQHAGLIGLGAAPSSFNLASLTAVAEGVQSRSSQPQSGAVTPKASIVVGSPALRKTRAARLRELESAAAIAVPPAAAAISGDSKTPPQLKSPPPEVSATSTGSSFDVDLAFTRTVILNGPKGSGKLGVCMNALRGTDFVPLVHTCYSRESHLQLGIGRSIANWFTSHTDDEVRQAAAAALKALHSGQTNFAFKLLIALIAKATTLMAVAVIIRRVQFIDAGSAAFLGALNTRFRTNLRLCIMLTAYPVYTNPFPTKVFMAYSGVVEFDVSQITVEEVGNLMQHELRSPVTHSTVRFVADKAARLVTFVCELVKYLSETASFMQLPSGEVGIDARIIKEVEATSWAEISRTVVLLTVHLLDFLTPIMRMIAKIVCAITEQPAISAFFYSVSRCCQLMIGHRFTPEDARFLQELRLLEMCEHRCTAHTGTGELDAAVFAFAPMRDVVQSLLVPAQRVQINAICAAAYAETHPMSHPMQFLVRARHYLFAEDKVHYLADIESGWRMIDAGNFTNGTERKEQQRLKAAYRNWIFELSLDQLAPFMSADDLDETRAMRAKMRQRLSRQRSSGAVVEAGLRWLGEAQRQAFPIILGPPRDDLRELLHALKQISERVFTVRQTLDVATIANTGHPHGQGKGATSSDADSATSSASTPRLTCTISRSDLEHFARLLERYIRRMRINVQARFEGIRQRCAARSQVDTAGLQSDAIASGRKRESRARGDLPGIPYVEATGASDSRRASVIVDDDDDAELVELTEALEDLEANSASALDASLIGTDAPLDPLAPTPVKRRESSIKERSASTPIQDQSVAGAATASRRRVLDADLLFRGITELLRVLRGPTRGLAARRGMGVSAVGTGVAAAAAAARGSSPLRNGAAGSGLYDDPLTQLTNAESQRSVMSMLCDTSPNDATCALAQRLVEVAVAAFKGHCESQLPELVAFMARESLRGRLLEAAFWAAQCAKKQRPVPQAATSAAQLPGVLAAPGGSPNVTEAARIISRILSLLADGALTSDKTAVMLLFGHLPLIFNSLSACRGACPVATAEFDALETEITRLFPAADEPGLDPVGDETSGANANSAAHVEMRYTNSELFDSLCRALLGFSHELKERDAHHDPARKQFATFFAFWVRAMCM